MYYIFMYIRNYIFFIAVIVFNYNKIKLQTIK
jgi:hypothetical protein